ncbi:MAG: hypothetical protein PHV18_10085 [Lachnospiraceae bacterium]|nr:hypothetical protein [Lachnospiraceae bacterium]
MDKNFCSASWAATALWVREVSPLELAFRAAGIALVPCAMILSITEITELIGGFIQ